MVGRGEHMREGGRYNVECMVRKKEWKGWISLPGV